MSGLWPMWSDLLRALALVFVIEGIVPFASPGRSRLLFERLARLDVRVIRLIGLSSMIGGLITLQLVRWLG